MYFVSSGAVEVVSMHGDVLAVLGEHAIFGEMALLNPDGRSVASIRVSSWCEGYRLSRDAFLQLTHQYPAFHQYVESVAKMRLRGPTGKKKTHKLSESESTGYGRLSPIKRKLAKATQKGTMKSLQATSMKLRSGANILAHFSFTHSNADHVRRLSSMSHDDTMSELSAMVLNNMVQTPGQGAQIPGGPSTAKPAGTSEPALAASRKRNKLVGASALRA